MRYEADLHSSPLAVRPTEHQSWQTFGVARDGATSIYRTKSGTNRTELLVVRSGGPPRVFASFEGTAIDLTLSPDETSVLYLYVDPAGQTLSLRRANLDSGAPVVIENLPYRPSVPPESTKMLIAQLVCARYSDHTCVLGATEGDQQVFYELDPTKGRGRRQAVLRGPRGSTPWCWDLSPDGERVVVGHADEPVHLIELVSGSVHDLLRDPAGHVFRIAWLGRTGEVLLVAGQVMSTEFRRVDAAGKMTTLWRRDSGQGMGDIYVNPAGSSLEFSTAAWSRSIWLLEPGS
jgi:hypothetical protein